MEDSGQCYARKDNWETDAPQTSRYPHSGGRLQSGVKTDIWETTIEKLREPWDVRRFTGWIPQTTINNQNFTHK
jgi:hypothetical protein